MPFKSKKKQKSYKKAWNKKNRQKQKKYNIKWRNKVRLWYINCKNDTECCVCGENRSSVLEFHHVHPENKTFCIYEGIKKGISIRRLEIEVKKCIVLCCKCHRLYHTNSFNEEEQQIFEDQIRIFEENNKI
jgi:hypothetical protein